MRMDVTDITKKWLSSSIANEGFIVKRSGSIGNLDSNTDEGSTSRLGNFAFFSRDTHTIYQPKLEVIPERSSSSLVLYCHSSVWPTDHFGSSSTA